MLPHHQPDHVRIAFDDHRLVPNAGLILPSTPVYPGVGGEPTPDDIGPGQVSKLKPRWDVHLSGDDDQLGCAGKSLSSVLGE